jgi:hypothetical protein
MLRGKSLFPQNREFSATEQGNFSEGSVKSSFTIIASGQILISVQEAARQQESQPLAEITAN